ncbi:hypothetical protein GCM10009535_48160 [Streptomyces thermocarboxydovorans]|uniref:Transcriptional regulator n=1 Tax=Streptomyces thermocarboxydovorans TaxID=59298 RepID=A0ABN1HQJ8_9ACTN
MPEHEADGSPHTATPEVADFLRRRREQIAQQPGVGHHGAGDLLGDASAAAA